MKLTSESESSEDENSQDTLDDISPTRKVSDGNLEQFSDEVSETPQNENLKRIMTMQSMSGGILKLNKVRSQ